MSVPDYVRFEPGNPMTDHLTGEWFQTTDLFGYFEKYRIKSDGTIWLTPSRLIPSDEEKIGFDAPELVKIDLPEVQILLRSTIRLKSDVAEAVATFRDGLLESLCDHS